MMTVNVVFIMLIYFHDVDDDVVNEKKQWAREYLLCEIAPSDLAKCFETKPFINTIIIVFLFLTIFKYYASTKAKPFLNNTIMVFVYIELIDIAFQIIVDESITI